MTRLPLLALLLVTTAAPAVAQQQQDVGRRVDRLEREMRAVQRQVFPNGGPQTQVVAPDIQPEAPAADAPGNPANAAVSNLTQRVNALEAQLAEITGQSEQAQYRLRQLEERVQRLAEELARRPEPQPVAPPVLDAPAPTPTPAPAPRPGQPRPATPLGQQTPAPAATGGDRVARVAAIQRPSTGDAAEDGYTYGYRLWQARLYPEAQAALKAVAEANPRHRRYSWAQNLLGRAYLDDGKPALAAVAFYDNYQANRDGERAADSLYYLGVSLIEQNQRTQACRVFAEFDEVYGTTARPELRTQVGEARTRARCRA